MRLAIVVQRYGEEVVGGSERHARMLAEKLVSGHDVTVLTTCARDYRTWKDEFEPGESFLNGVPVVRFSVVRERKWKYFGWKSRRLFTAKAQRREVLDEYKWLVEQGPEVPELLEYLRVHRDDFDLFVFFTYLYYPTFFGLPVVADKAILVPTAHDEPAIYLSIFNTLFHLPRFIAFNTEVERDFIHRLFHNRHIPHDEIGIGMDLPQVQRGDDGFLLYAGRVERGKNCEEIFDLNIPVKVIGQAQIKVPRHVDYLGYVEEEQKSLLFSRCRAVINPSRQESLSLVVLEAWAHGKPVIVSAESPVLRAQVEQSGGGYIYSNMDELRQITTNIDSSRGLLGRKYVEEKYSWEVVLEKWEKALQAALFHTD